MFSILSQMFVPERHRPRAGEVGFSVPAFSEVDVVAGVDPLLATNMRGTFLKTRTSRQGTARFGFTECPLAHEEKLIQELYRVLRSTALEREWGTVASVPDACARITAAGLRPTLVVSSESPGIHGLRSLLTPSLVAGSALVIAQPEASGLYTRIGDHVGILVYRIHAAIVVVSA